MMNYDGEPAWSEPIFSVKMRQRSVYCIFACKTQRTALFGIDFVRVQLW